MTDESLFVAALDIPDPGERARHLDAACAGDAALRRRVEELLAAHAMSGDFLDVPAAEQGGGLAATRPPEAARDGTAGTLPWAGPATAGGCEAAGAVVGGRYKLVEPIGAGGMGAVWMAQQTAPVRRLVAVKLIKAGMDSRQVLARFDAERQALAVMDHPNIARVLDAGAAPDGRPYFVMELVRGVPITDFCDARRLAPRERLALFAPVCRALQHAHQKGVIHRDVKPSNVLVALYDDRPVPKVIDFGVAKAAGEPLTDHTLVTGFGAVVGTPTYMAPEQATLNSLDVDTRADVYGLGALLYELLTGSPPFARADLQKAGLLEMLRVVREVDPPPPSTRVSTSAARPAVAAARGTDPGRLAGLLRSDLDWVVMKAMDKDRARRYETAAGLADDVERYLAGEPVRAAPPSAWYRVRKFARRHRRGVAAAAALGVAVAAGLAGTAGGLVRAERAAADARDAAARANTLNAQLRRLLESADPGGANGPDYTVVQLLDDYAGRLGEGLDGQPAVEAELRTTVGRVYLSLDRPDRAEREFRAALALRRGAPAPDPRAVAASMTDLAEVLDLRPPDRDLPAAEWLARALEAHGLADGALDHLRRAGGDPDEATARALIVQGWAIATEEGLRGVAGRAEGPLRAGRGLAVQLAGGQPSALVAQADECLADCLAVYRRYPEAEEAGRSAVAGWGAARGDGHVSTAWARVVLGNAQTLLDDYPAAEASHRRALAAFRRAYGDRPHQRTAFAVGYLVAVLALQFKDAEADRVLADCPPGWRAAGYGFPAGAMAADRRGYACLERGDYGDAEGHFRAALAAPAGLGGEWLTKEMRCGLAVALAFQGKDDDARRELEDDRTAALQLAGGSAPPAGAADLTSQAETLLLGGAGHPGELEAAVKLSGWELDRLAGQSGAARAAPLYVRLAARHRLGSREDHGEVVAGMPQVLRDLGPWRLRARREAVRCLVGSLEALGKDAEPVLRAAVSEGIAALPPGHPEVAARRVELAAYLARHADYEPAAGELLAAEKLLAGHPQASERSLVRRRADVAGRLADVYARRGGRRGEVEH